MKQQPQEKIKVAKHPCKEDKMKIEMLLNRVVLPAELLMGFSKEFLEEDEQGSVNFNEDCQAFGAKEGKLLEGEQGLVVSLWSFAVSFSFHFQPYLEFIFDYL